MRNSLKRWTLAVLSGSVLMQVPGCTETAIAVTTVASVLTAGGVLFLVRRVIE